MNDYLLQQQEAELVKKQEQKQAARTLTLGGAGEDALAASAAPKEPKEDDMVHSEKMAHALKILERMVNQNAEDEIFQDFKYWEDASDSFRDGEARSPRACARARASAATS